MPIFEFDIAALIISLIVLINYERKKHVRDGLSAIFVTMTWMCYMRQERISSFQEEL